MTTTSTTSTTSFMNNNNMFTIGNINKFFIIFLIFVFLHQLQIIDGIFLPRKIDFKMQDRVMLPKKRPFCNAFTGCGKKRSSNIPTLNNNLDEETVGNLLELSAEPAVEDLSRQILSEAKLWEAIQEANMELKRRRHANDATNNANENTEDDVAVPARSATASCALPPCYI